ncbi:MAG: 7-cyano-7-deazaguanine synthase QueC [Gammaproteobacteria bacterium]|jgi:7-cyano-7-deazaguanine synthase|nr:7-cyano-7-deazaguanine synthase QueC [Gammaproteobacteria bacterium]
MDKSIVLLSGGMDSATALSIAKRKKLSCYALTMDYGQKHSIEIEKAKLIAEHFQVVEHKIIEIDLTVFGGSALTDKNINIPEHESQGIPVTYVPARNTIFFSLALAWAEVIQANSIYSGVNAIDYSGYPDCRPEYIKAMQALVNLATKATVEGSSIAIEAPLLDMNKMDIIKKGIENNVDFSKTVSCYQLSKHSKSCGVCDSCRIRLKAFEELNLIDQIEYV